MPLLFKNGKLVVNDIDQLVFSDDPNSCRCCPGLCECPSGSDYAVPKYIDDLSIEWSNIPASYEETRNQEVINRLQNGSVATYRLNTSITINGLDGLNGTWPALLSETNGGATCTAPNPVPPCVYDDTRAACSWWQRVPVVSISGTYSREEYQDLRAYFPNSSVTDTNQTYYITGKAQAAIGQVFGYGCLSTDAYGVDKVGGFGFAFIAGPKATYKDTVGSRVSSRTDCTLNTPIVLGLGSGLPKTVAFPSMLLPLSITTSSNACQVDVDSIPNDPFYVDGPPWATCTDFSSLGSSGSFSLNGCSGSGSESGQSGTVAYSATWSYTQSNFAWDYTRSISILP